MRLVTGMGLPMPSGMHVANSRALRLSHSAGALNCSRLFLQMAHQAGGPRRERLWDLPQRVPQPLFQSRRHRRYRLCSKAAHEGSPTLHALVLFVTTSIKFTQFQGAVLYTGSSSGAEDEGTSSSGDSSMQLSIPRSQAADEGSLSLMLLYFS